MQEYVVTLRNGLRFTVRANRVFVADGYVALIDDAAVQGSTVAFDGAVGLFDEREVAVVFSKGHLISQEKGDPIDPQHVVGSDIPF